MAVAFYFDRVTEYGGGESAFTCKVKVFRNGVVRQFGKGKSCGWGAKPVDRETTTCIRCDLLREEVVPSIGNFGNGMLGRRTLADVVGGEVGS